MEIVVEWRHTHEQNDKMMRVREMESGRGRRGEREKAHSRERKQTSKKQSLFTIPKAFLYLA